jgi:hypothetical protein
MPTFCRHGTLSESCPICRASVESANRAAVTRGSRAPVARSTARGAGTAAAGGARGRRLTIRHETRSEDDGFRTPAAPGLRSSADAERLAEELARSYGRIEALAADPPGLYAEVALEADL